MTVGNTVSVGCTVVGTAVSVTEDDALIVGIKVASVICSCPQPATVRLMTKTRINASFMFIGIPFTSIIISGGWPHDALDGSSYGGWAVDVDQLF